MIHMFPPDQPIGILHIGILKKGRLPFFSISMCRVSMLQPGALPNS